MPSAPHPELTAEQKQHISDRSSALASSGQLTGQLLGRRMMGAGHSRPGGSVAERVLMFEKSPSAFGVEPVQVGSNPIRLQSKIKMYKCTIYFPCSQVRVPQRREPQLSGTVITPWKPSLETASSRAQAQHQVISQSLTPAHI